MPRWPRRSAGPLTPDTALQVRTSSLSLLCFLLTQWMVKPVFCQTGHIHCVPDTNTAVDHAIHVFLLESLEGPLRSLFPNRSEHVSTAPTMFESHPGGTSLMVSSRVKVTMREVVGAVHTARGVRDMPAVLLADREALGTAPTAASSTHSFRPSRSIGYCHPRFVLVTGATTEPGGGGAGAAEAGGGDPAAALLADREALGAALTAAAEAHAAHVDALEDRLATAAARGAAALARHLPC